MRARAREVWIGAFVGPAPPEIPVKSCHRCGASFSRFELARLELLERLGDELVARRCRCGERLEIDSSGWERWDLTLLPEVWLRERPGEPYRAELAMMCLELRRKARQRRRIALAVLLAAFLALAAAAGGGC